MIQLSMPTKHLTSAETAQLMRNIRQLPKIFWCISLISQHHDSLLCLYVFNFITYFGRCQDFSTKNPIYHCRRVKHRLHFCCPRVWPVKGRVEICERREQIRPDLDSERKSTIDSGCLADLSKQPLTVKKRLGNPQAPDWAIACSGRS